MTLIETAAFGAVNYLMNKYDATDKLVRKETESAYRTERIMTKINDRLTQSIMYIGITTVIKKIYNYYNYSHIDHFSSTLNKLKQFVEAINEEKNKYKKNINCNIETVQNQNENYLKLNQNGNFFYDKQ